jgi:hypothetical protein
MARVGNPEAVVGGDVDHGIAAGERGLERLWVGQVAHVRLAVDAFEVGQVAGLADQQAQLGALSGQSLAPHDGLQIPSRL